MSSICRISLIISVVAFALIASKLYAVTKSLPVPEFETDRYWGRGNASDYQASDEIRAQEVFYTDEQIDRIRSKLNETINFLRPLEDVDHEYGMNTYQLHSILEYWRDDYLPRFNERQEYLNSIPHFLTHLQGLNVHFVHVKGEQNEESNATVIPVLLLHGWTSSVREFYDLISLLTQSHNESEYSFEVIVPSLAGFGWSEGAAKQGFGAFEQSIVLRNLMLRLGHDRFYVHGSELSSAVGSAMATLFPENVIGFHSTMCTVPTYLSLAKSLIGKAVRFDIDSSSFVEPFSLLVKESGLMHLQATKPDTIGIVLSDNPVGLAAVILDKFISYFDTIDRDTILDNLTIYALTNCFATSTRLYAETFSRREMGLQIPRVPTQVPTGCIRFKNHIVDYSDWQLTEKYPNLVHSAHYETGGQFGAMEVPELLYTDFLTFVDIVQKKQ